MFAILYVDGVKSFENLGLQTSGEMESCVKIHGNGPGKWGVRGRM